MFKIDISKLEEILKYESVQEQTSETPNFYDDNDQIGEGQDPAVKIPEKTRLQNVEIQIENLYKLISRLADEMRVQRASLNEIAARRS